MFANKTGKEFDETGKEYDHPVKEMRQTTKEHTHTGFAHLFRRGCIIQAIYSFHLNICAKPIVILPKTYFAVRYTLP